MSNRTQSDYLATFARILSILSYTTWNAAQRMWGFCSNINFLSMRKSTYHAELMHYAFMQKRKGHLPNAYIYASLSPAPRYCEICRRLGWWSRCTCYYNNLQLLQGVPVMTCYRYDEVGNFNFVWVRIIANTDMWNDETTGTRTQPCAYTSDFVVFTIYFCHTICVNKSTERSVLRQQTA